MACTPPSVVTNDPHAAASSGVSRSAGSGVGSLSAHLITVADRVDPWKATQTSPLRDAKGTPAMLATARKSRSNRVPCARSEIARSTCAALAPRGAMMAMLPKGSRSGAGQPRRDRAARPPCRARSGPRVSGPWPRDAGRGLPVRANHLGRCHRTRARRGRGRRSTRARCGWPRAAPARGTIAPRRRCARWRRRVPGGRTGCRTRSHTLGVTR